MAVVAAVVNFYYFNYFKLKHLKSWQHSTGQYFSKHFLCYVQITHVFAITTLWGDKLSLSLSNEMWHKELKISHRVWQDLDSNMGTCTYQNLSSKHREKESRRPAH